MSSKVVDLSRIKSATSKRNLNNGAEKKEPVKVVACPNGFPISDKVKTYSNPVIKPAGSSSYNADTDTAATKLLDWDETVKEIRHYGAQAFEKQQKRSYQDEEYFKLTGRERKKQKMPLPLVRALRKAQVARDEKKLEEAKAMGVVLPKSSLKSKNNSTSDKKQKQRQSIEDNYGPAPSIGFVKGGVLKVRRDINQKRKR